MFKVDNIIPFWRVMFTGAAGIVGVIIFSVSVALLLPFFAVISIE